MALFSALLLAGCAAGGGTTLQVDRVQVALLLSDVKAQYVLVSHLLGQACAAKKLDPETCASLDVARKEAAILERQVRKALVAPAAAQGLDMEQLSEYLGVLMKLAGKAAL